MFRKIAIIMPMFILCLGLDNCKSPEEPEEPNYEYRHNVEIIYTRVAAVHSEGSDYENLHYDLYDPAIVGNSSRGDIQMNKIGENKYRCYLPKVFIQTLGRHRFSHHVSVGTISTALTGENIDIQGAYDQQIFEIPLGSVLWFKMSKE